MALTADQKATLELVLGRGQDYAELSELLGASEAEVRERARSALEALAGTDPDRHVALTDYLLGQADPIARADAVRHLREDAGTHRLATELLARLRELVPDAELPRLPEEPRGGRFLRRDPVAGPAPETSAAAAGQAGPIRLSQRQSRLLVGLVASAVLVVVAVLAIAGAFGGEGEQTPAAAPEDEQPAATALGDVLPEAPGRTVLRGAVPVDEEETGDADEIRVPLSAVGDRAGAGEATFGLTGGDTVFVELGLRGLEPAGEDETYVLWLMLTREQGWPLTPVEVSGNGRFDSRLPIPAELLTLVAQMRFVSIELTSNEALAEVIQGVAGQLAPQGGLGTGDPGSGPGPGG